jgi:hypothetical protein
VHLALHHHAFTTHIGRLAAQLPVQVLQGMTWGVWWLEVAGPLLFFLPWATGVWRCLMVVAFVGFHFGLFLCMELGPFPWVAMTCWLAIIPSWFWDHPARALLRRWKLKRRLAGFAQKLASKLRALRARLRLPLPAPPRVRPSRLGTVVVLGLASYTGYGTVYATQHGGSVNGEVFEPLLMSRLYANWGMFAPNPPNTSGWFVSVAKQENGEEIDIWNGGGPVSWEEPALPSKTFKRERWRKFSDNIIADNHRVVRPYFLRWLCKDYNEEHQGPERATDIRLFHMAQTTRFPLKGYGPVSKVEIGYERCPEPVVEGEATDK